MNPDEFYAYLAGKTDKSADELKKADEGKEWNQKLIGAHLQQAWNVHPTAGLCSVSPLIAKLNF